MTVSKQLTVFCDKCMYWVYVDALTKTGARKEVKKFGWKVINDKDICPNPHGTREDATE